MRRVLVGFGAAVLVAACTTTIDHPPPTKHAEDAMMVKSVEWNPTQVYVGAVDALAQSADATILFCTSSVMTLRGGTVASNVASKGAWSGATTIPAADGNGTWIVGVTSGGALLHLRSTGSFEDVRGRYAIADRSIVSVLALDGVVAFGFAGGFAIADGKKVRRFDASTDGHLAGGGHTLAWIDHGNPITFDVATATERRWPLNDAAFVSIDADGRLVAATKRAVWSEDASDGALHLRWTADVGDLHGIASSKPRVWLAVGSELAALEQGVVSRSDGLALPTDARLAPADGGDVWVLSQVAREPLRFGRDPADLKRVDWQSTMLPIFARVCSSCHEPSGTAQLDLSTYRAWLDERDALRKRVVDERTMPPKTTTFADADRDAIRAWLDRNPR